MLQLVDLHLSMVLHKSLIAGRIYEHAHVHDYTEVYGTAIVSGYAELTEDARVYGRSEVTEKMLVSTELLVSVEMQGVCKAKIPTDKNEDPSTIECFLYKDDIPLLLINLALKEHGIKIVQNQKQKKVRQTMKPIEEINPELFLFELYEVSMLQSLESWELACYAIGYCDAGRLYVRPKSGEVALMCELPDGNKMWSHISKCMLDGLNRMRENGRGIPQWAYEEAEKQN